MGDLIGRQFAGYAVRDVLRTDLVSTTYRAEVPGEGQSVALQVIAPDLSKPDLTDPELYREFLSHAEAALTLSHDGLPAVEEVGEQHGLTYIVSEFVEGVPLGDVLRKYAPLKPAAAVSLLGQIANVLDAGHARRLIHGAVSPSTVWVGATPDDDIPSSAYLTGYGIGAILELRIKRDRKDLEVQDDLLYVAPEQLRQQRPSGRTDQYSLACALYHALTGQPPFVRDSIGGLFGAHLFVDADLDEFPSVWAEALAQGMAKEPVSRFDSCRALVAAVSERAIGSEHDVWSRPARGQSGLSDDLARRAARRGWGDEPSGEDPTRTAATPLTVAAGPAAPAPLSESSVVIDDNDYLNSGRFSASVMPVDAPLLSEVLAQRTAPARVRVIRVARWLALLVLLLLLGAAALRWLRADGQGHEVAASVAAVAPQADAVADGPGRWRQRATDVGARLLLSGEM